MNNMNFVVETFIVENGMALKSVERDSDGYFKGLPLAVLGDVTRNKTHYDEETMINQIVKPSAFNLRLTEGNLSGEWGHPVVDYSTILGKTRVMTIEPTREALHYRRIYSKPLKSSNKIAIFGDAKPSGPYGAYFEERMLDPTRNCAFSLRSITQDRVDQRTGVTYKRVAQLITFDAGVPSGGYKEASKRYMSNEALNGFVSQPIEYSDLMNMKRAVGFESLIDDEVLEMFQANKVIVKKEVIGVVDLNNRLVHNAKTGEKRSIFGSFLSI